MPPVVSFVHYKPPTPKKKSNLQLLAMYFKGLLNCVYLNGVSKRITMAIWMSVNPPLPFFSFYVSIQRKSLDLNLQSATAPSRGKTLPTPVQPTFFFSLKLCSKPTTE